MEKAKISDDVIGQIFFQLVMRSKITKKKKRESQRIEINSR